MTERGRQEYADAVGVDGAALWRVHRRPLYLSTLCAVDDATSWTKLVAIWGVGDERVDGAVQHVAAQVPTLVRAWHSDNGSELLNRDMDSCRRHPIDFARGRPYRKSDRASLCLLSPTPAARSPWF